MKNDPEEMIRSIVARFDTDEKLEVSTAYGDGGTNLLFPRLARAAMNQCYEGDAMVSRYAIWANTARDHISAAIHLIENNEKEQGLRLLISAHNSLSAFSEIQKQLDPLNREMEA
jgi:hypothetical protein